MGASHQKQRPTCWRCVVWCSDVALGALKMLGETYATVRTKDEREEKLGDLEFAVVAGGIDGQRPCFGAFYAT